MKEPSLRGPRPNGVLITRSTFPPRISSATLSGPSVTFATRSTGMPARSSTPAVPLVASSRNPRSASRFAGNTIARLSRFATRDEHRAAGRQTACPAATIAFASAMPGSPSIPITSPVDFISGPSTVSTPGNRPNGRTAAFTRRVREVPVVVRIGGQHAVGARARRAYRPVSTSVAIRASDTPITFETNGTVREARGFASSTQIRSSFTASCRFSRPSTPRRRASRRVMSSISSSSSSESVAGGIWHDESPECTPASSMCSITAPMNTSEPSDTASTSTSIAPSRNRSISTGWSGDASAAVRTNVSSSSAS